jgi:hypothetical protein
MDYLPNKALSDLQIISLKDTFQTGFAGVL